jgi:crossover junction endodeoxyribonuclease RusA
MIINAKIPWPPTINHYYIRAKSGQVIKNSSAQKYVHAVALMLRAKRLGEFAAASKLRVELRVYPPDARRRDLDNLCKCVLDVLQHAGLYSDDFSVSQLYVERMEQRPLGEIEVTISDI